MQAMADSETDNIELSASDFAALLRLPRTPWVEPHDAVYLKEVPQLSAEMAKLAGKKRLTAAEEQAIGAEVRRICQLIRAARIQWEIHRADAVPSL